MNKKAKIGLIVVAIALIAGVTYGVMNMSPATPEEEVMEAEKRTANLDSYSIKMLMDMEVEGIEEAPDVSFSGEGDYDRLNQSFVGEGEFNISMEGLVANFGAGITYIDDNIYGRITTFPYMALPLGSDHVEMLTENDILLFENVKENIDIFLGGLFTEMDMDPMTLDELLIEAERLSERMWNDGVITVSEVEEDELNDKPATKYHLRIDSEKASDFAIQLLERAEEEGIFGDLDEDTRGELFADIEREMMTAYEDVETYAWIQDGYLVRVKSLSTTSIDEDEIPNIEDLDEVPESVTVKMVVDYFNFDHDFEITAPEEYITLEEVINELQILPMLDMDFDFENMEELEGELNI